MCKIEIELWKEICYKDIKHIYLISSHGRVYSTLNNKVLKLSIDKYGYNVISLQTTNKQRPRRTFKVHRLVKIHFPMIDENCVLLNKHTVNHIDGCKTNNKWNNLE